MAKVDITVVTYKGTGPLTNDLLGGHVPLGFNTIPASVSQIAAGQLRGLAVAGDQALGGAARCADSGRVRTARLRSGSVLRAGGAGRHAAPQSSSGSTKSCAPCSRPQTI